MIGLGSIGTLVANDALLLGMDVIGYDPFISYCMEYVPGSTTFNNNRRTTVKIGLYFGSCSVN